MQVQWNIIIAGIVVVACLSLVIIALVWGKQRDAGPAPLPEALATLPPPSPVLPSSASLDTTDPWSSIALPPPAPAVVSPPASAALPSTTTKPAAIPAPAAAAPVRSAAPGATAEQPAAPGSAPAAAASPQHGGTTHAVAKGETLGDISAHYYGSARHWRRIVEANPGLDPTRLRPGQTIHIPPAPHEPATASATTDGGSGAVTTYTVKPGESYYTIARKVLGNPSRWRELEQLNGIPAEELHAGQVIKIPAKDKEEAKAPPAASGGRPAQRIHTVAAGETLGDISQRYYGTSSKWKLIVEANPGVRPENLSVGQQLRIPEAQDGHTAAATTAPSRAGGSRVYVVKAGDTLASIAASQLGSREAWKKIVDANPGIRPEALRVGQELIIPDAAPAPSPQTAAPQKAAPTAPPASTPASPPPSTPTFADDPFFSPYQPLPMQ